MTGTWPNVDDARAIARGVSRPELLNDVGLAALFGATCRHFPNNVALASGERRLTYAELDLAANEIANGLVDAGIGRGDVVGLSIPRGIDALVAQLAITKSGAAWLPFDESIPLGRVAECLSDAGAVLLVTTDDTIVRLEDVAIAAQTIDSLRRRRNAAPVCCEDTQADDLAYVIYTSGSTGKPKGIGVCQGNICHFLRSENTVLRVVDSDRVYQGFSLAFDMSFEEIWIAYLTGASLYIAPRFATDPDVLARELVSQQITVLHTVPTLLALIDADVPSLRLINVGGEAVSASLIERWHVAGRRIINSYGPTEATVSASAIELVPGAPITIGRPLPNMSMLVVKTDAESLELCEGDVGELCISGPGIAKGYLNRPDLTQVKFCHNPWSRSAVDRVLYRTGDLARITASGEIELHGRLDDQVKVRGFRIEIGDIEAHLTALPDVDTAAVVVQRIGDADELVAFVVSSERAPAGPSYRERLASCVPSYMVPSRFTVLDELPRLLSGKVDRSALRRLRAVEASDPRYDDVPCGEAEAVLFAALREIFPGEPIARRADFFADLGGHSLHAARLASALRSDPHYSHFSVRDVYERRTVGEIGEAMATGRIDPAVAAPRRSVTPQATFSRVRCGAAQAIAIPFLVVLRMARWLAPFFVYHDNTGDPGDSIPVAVLESVLAFLIATAGIFAITIAGKWLIGGRARAGRYPLWGMTYFRWWFADRLMEAAPVYMLAGSWLHAAYLRALGAKIGHGVHVGTLTLRAPDLLRIGDDASIGNAVNFSNARVENGELILGTIAIERYGCVGSACVLEGNTGVGEYGHLEGLSSLCDGEHVPSERIWAGSPVAETGTFDPKELPPRPPVTARRRAFETLYFPFASLFVAVLFFMPVFPAFMLIDWLDQSQDDVAPSVLSAVGEFMPYFLLALPASAILIAVTIGMCVAVRWTVLPRLRPSRSPLHGETYYKKWLVNQILDQSLQVLHGIYATLYAPAWYRLLGARVGRGAEISTAAGVVPDLLDLGEDTFVADDVMLGDDAVDGGWVTSRQTTIGARSFIGNSAYIPDGTRLPSHCLIGVLSSAPCNDRIEAGQTWLGAPPIRLPAREEHAGFAEHLTFRPTLRRRIARGIVEGLRIVIPHAFVIAFGYTTVMTLMPFAADDRWLAVIGGLAAAGLLFGLTSFAFVLLLKWLVVRRYTPRAAPMWTWFVWSSEAVTNLYEGLAVPNFLHYLRGTPWLPLALRLFGAKIGTGVYLDTTDITEFDCVRIGDYSEINEQAGPQTHLFEDRIMKVDHVRIGEHVTIGARSTILYGASVEDGVRVGSLTLIMKGESLPAGSVWRGSPAVRDER